MIDRLRSTQTVKPEIVPVSPEPAVVQQFEELRAYLDKLDHQGNNQYSSGTRISLWALEQVDRPLYIYSIFIVRAFCSSAAIRCVAGVQQAQRRPSVRDAAGPRGGYRD